MSCYIPRGPPMNEKMIDAIIKLVLYLPVHCHWCGKFISQKERLATRREPNIFYCRKCYRKGLEEEKIAMGYYDE